MSSPTPGTAGTDAGARHPAALWFMATVFVTFLAASTAPTPLYELYRAEWKFSALTLTLIFSTYAFALLAALLVFGSLSDYRGRREILVVALVLELAAMLVFRNAGSATWLFVARAVQGVATGMATSTLSAGMVDVQPQRGAMLNSIAPLFGMGVGALGAGALAQFVPAPTHDVFDVLLVVLALQAVAAFRLPETVSRRDGAIAAMRPRLAVPARAWPTLLQLLPVNTAVWALVGFYSSLGPSLARIVAGAASPFLGGAVLASLVLGGAGAVLLTRTLPARRVLAGATVTLMIGVCVTLASVEWHSLVGFFAGSLVAGLGLGSGFNAAIRTLVPLAESKERAGLMSTYYVLSYLSFSLPSIGAGVLTGRDGLQPASLIYGLLLLILGGVALAMMARRQEGA